MTRSVKRLPTESKEDILARHEFRRKRAEERARHEEKVRWLLEPIKEFRKYWTPPFDEDPDL